MAVKSGLPDFDLGVNTAPKIYQVSASWSLLLPRYVCFIDMNQTEGFSVIKFRF